MSTQIGVATSDKGAAIVVATHDPQDNVVVTDIEPLPFNFEVVARRLEELDGKADADTQFVVDEEGIGGALFDACATDARLNDPKGRDPVRTSTPVHRRRWTSSISQGAERQQLVNTLLVVTHEGRLRFLPGLAAEELMKQALLSYRRQVGADGVIGSELIVALCLAVTPRPPHKSMSAYLA